MPGCLRLLDRRRERDETGDEGLKKDEGRGMRDDDGRIEAGPSLQW